MSRDVAITISSTEKERFRNDGFVVKPEILSGTFLGQLRERFPLLFQGKFDTGIYPDEWYWREEMSRPDVTRHMANAWKSDLTVARLVLSEEIGRAVGELTGWDEVRLGQDTIWWKPPGTKSISYHQDTSFMQFLDPPETATCWVALDETKAEAGTLEYVPGSHKWPLTPLPEEFHAKDDFRWGMRRAAEAVGVTAAETVYVEAPAGSCSIHAGELWHGSGPNTTADRMRRSIGVHLLPGHAKFSDRHGGYIYRRYQRTGVAELDESFFPIVWSRNGRRTGWIEEYLASGVRR